MSVRTISRAAIGGYIKLVRLPFDAAAGMLDRDGRAGPSPATIALDRMDAMLRGAAGRTLRDHELVRDAERRRLAADERERASRLHAEAQLQSERADERLSERERRAQQQRRQAARRSAERKKQAEQEREAESRRIAQAEARRRRANQNAAARKEESIEDRAKRARLRQLDEEDDALAKQQEALTARDESQRLRRAAAKTKAARKRGGS